MDSLKAADGQTFPWKTSIGLILIEHRMIREGEELQANGQTFVGPLLYVSRSRLKHNAILNRAGRYGSAQAHTFCPTFYRKTLRWILNPGSLLL